MRGAGGQGIPVLARLRATAPATVSLARIADFHRASVMENT
jgi:hypothetical protein